MPSSKLGHYSRFIASQMGATQPVDSGMAGRALGNLNHLADQCAQVRVAWTAPTGLAIGYNEDGPTVDGFQALWTSTPFDLHINDDGTSYPCRLRMRLAAEEQGFDSHPPIFRFVLAPEGASQIDMVVADPVSVAELSVDNGGVMTWYAHGSLLRLNRRKVSEATRSVQTRNSIGGGLSTAAWLRVELSAWARVGATGDDIASLGGLELAEYYAP